MFLDDLNKLINNSFAYSNVNTTDLKSIDGKSLKIDLLNTNTVIFIEINNEKILLKDEIENEPSITILASNAIKSGKESPIGEAVAIFPAMVPTFRI